MAFYQGNPPWRMWVGLKIIGLRRTVERRAHCHRHRALLYGTPGALIFFCLPRGAGAVFRWGQPPRPLACCVFWLDRTLDSLLRGFAAPPSPLSGKGPLSAAGLSVKSSVVFLFLHFGHRVTSPSCFAAAGFGFWCLREPVEETAERMSFKSAMDRPRNRWPGGGFSGT